MLKTEKIILDIYEQEILVFVADSIEEAIRASPFAYEMEGNYELINQIDGCFVNNPKTCEIGIILENSASLSIIAHECFHATMYVLQSLHLKFSDESEEAFAYLQGYLTQKVYEIQQCERIAKCN